MSNRLESLYEELHIDTNNITPDALDRLEQWIMNNISQDIILTDAAIERRAFIYEEVLKKYLNLQAYSLLSLDKLGFVVKYGLDVLLDNMQLSISELSKLEPLLEMACALGHVHTVRKLTHLGRFEPGTNSQILHRALMLPTGYDEQLKEKKQKVAQFLLSLWPNLLYSKTDENNNIFHTLAENNYPALIETYRTSHHQLATEANNLGYYPIHCAVMSHRHQSAAQLLRVAQGAKLLDDKQRTALHHASRLGDHEMVALCVQADPSVVNYQDINQQTALDFAYEFHHAQVAELLVAHGATTTSLPTPH